MQYRFAAKLLPLAAAIALLAAGGSALAQDATVKIGHVGPLTGAIAHLGKDNENGARLAIEEINKAGLTINGKKVVLELVAEDDAGDPKTGTAVAQKLVDAKVVAVVGHLNSGVSIPATRRTSMISVDATARSMSCCTAKARSLALILPVSVVLAMAARTA